MITTLRTNENIKGVFRGRQSKKNEQYIGQRNKSLSSIWSTLSLKGKFTINWTQYYELCLHPIFIVLLVVIWVSEWLFIYVK
jgi:hypothetical protein